MASDKRNIRTCGERSSGLQRPVSAGLERWDTDGVSGMGDSAQVSASDRWKTMRSESTMRLEDAVMAHLMLASHANYSFAMVCVPSMGGLGAQGIGAKAKDRHAVGEFAIVSMQRTRSHDTQPLEATTTYVMI